MNLNEVDTKKSFEIISFSEDFDENLLEKLHNFGIYEGAILYKGRENSSKGLIIFQIDNKEIGIRVADAKNIKVRIL